MNIPPFYIGQKIVCINNSGWYNINTGETYGPYYKEVCIVTGYENIELYGYKYPLLNCYGNEGGFDFMEFKAAQQIIFPLMKYSNIIEKEIISAN